MSNRYGPRIVTDGLVLCLDAADRNCYAGTGSTVYDLSGRSNNGTVNNSLPFSQNNGGYFDFNNTANDWYISGATSTRPSADGDATIEAFIYPYNSDQAGIIYNQGYSGNSFTHGIYYYAGLMRFRNTNGDYYFSPQVSVSANTWTHIVYASSSTETICYKNGTYAGSTGNRVKTATTGQYVIGRRAINADTNRFNGRIAFVKIYHKTLSASEVLQNYNATKGRFGL